MAQERGGLTAGQAGAVIAAQFPDLSALPVTALGEGTDHWAFDLGGEWVFRFPKSDEAADHLPIEARLTSWLASRLPLAVPAYRFLGAPGALFPRVFGGAARLPGRSALELPPGAVDVVTAGQVVGAALRVLHGLSTDTARRLGVQPEDTDAITEWGVEALKDLGLAHRHGQLSADEAVGWRRYLSAPPAAAAGPPRLIHGDLAAEHVLIETGGERPGPSGLIDWSDSVLGDPALDLAGLLHWGGPAMLRAALETYGPLDAGTAQRAHWYAVCRAFADLSFGRTQGRPAYVAAARWALRALRS